MFWGLVYVPPTGEGVGVELGAADELALVLL